MGNLSPILQMIIILTSQLIFVYLRTVNVKATAEGKIGGTILSGVGVGLTGLLSLAIGVDSLMEGRFLPVIFYLIGGAIGTYLAMIKKKKFNIK